MGIAIRLVKTPMFIAWIFLIHFIKSGDGQCDGSAEVIALTTSLQYTSSPGYNSDGYAANLSCSWILDAGDDDWNVLVFIEHHNTSCPGDVITVYDGHLNTNTSLIAPLCGAGDGDVSVSSSRYVLIEFNAGVGTSFPGFRFGYIAGKDFAGTGCTTPQKLTATTETNYLTTPNFPAEYDPSLSCRWVISTDVEGAIELDVAFNNIEEDTSCAFDHFEVFDGAYKCENNQIGKQCVQYPKTDVTSYATNGSNILVTFVSDGSVIYNGFMMKYRLIPVPVTDPPTTISTSVPTTTNEPTTDAPKEGISLGLILAYSLGGAVGLALIISVLVAFCIKVLKQPTGSMTQIQPLRNNMHSEVQISPLTRSNK